MFDSQNYGYLLSESTGEVYGEIFLARLAPGATSWSTMGAPGFPSGDFSCQWLAIDSLTAWSPPAATASSAARPSTERSRSPLRYGHSSIPGHSSFSYCFSVMGPPFLASTRPMVWRFARSMAVNRASVYPGSGWYHGSPSNLR